MPGRTPVEHCRHDCHINTVQGTGFCTSESTCAAACSIEQTVSWLPPSSFPPRPVQSRGQREQSRCQHADARRRRRQPLPMRPNAKPAPSGVARVGANHAVKDAGRTERAKPLRCAVPQMWNLLGSSSCEREGLPDICNSCMEMRLRVCPL
jgi:hypothetical protein